MQTKILKAGQGLRDKWTYILLIQNIVFISNRIELYCEESFFFTTHTELFLSFVFTALLGTLCLIVAVCCAVKKWRKRRANSQSLESVVHYEMPVYKND